MRLVVACGSFVIIKSMESNKKTNKAPDTLISRDPGAKSAELYNATNACNVGAYFKEQERIHPESARQQQFDYYILMIIGACGLLAGLLSAVYPWMGEQ